MLNSSSISLADRDNKS